jgi:hypothetical protein
LGKDSSGMSLIQDLKRENINPIAVEPKADKAIRMNAHTARIEGGSVFLPQSAHWLDEFRQELPQVCRGRLAPTTAYRRRRHQPFGGGADLAAGEAQATTSEVKMMTTPAQRRLLYLYRLPRFHKALQNFCDDVVSTKVS